MSFPADQRATVITADEAAELLKLSKPSLYSGARSGEIPCRRVGRRFIFCREALDRWLIETAASKR